MTPKRRCSVFSLIFIVNCISKFNLITLFIKNANYSVFIMSCSYVCVSFFVSFLAFVSYFAWRLIGTKRPWPHFPLYTWSSNWLNTFKYWCLRCDMKIFHIWTLVTALNYKRHDFLLTQNAEFLQIGKHWCQTAWTPFHLFFTSSRAVSQYFY